MAPGYTILLIESLLFDVVKSLWSSVMAKKKFEQIRSINVEITNVVKVDVDFLGLDLQHMSERELKTIIEQAWVNFINNEESVFDYVFEPVAITSSLQEDSLTIESHELISLDSEEEEID